VLSAANWVLRLISLVAAPCSSTADAMAELIELISTMVLLMPRIAPTAC
jgi:hypothetical protein